MLNLSLLSRETLLLVRVQVMHLVESEIADEAWQVDLQMLLEYLEVELDEL